jgi:hypothetical protein
VARRVDVVVVMGVAIEALPADVRLLDRELRHAARRDVDLVDPPVCAVTADRFGSGDTGAWPIRTFGCAIGMPPSVPWRG